MLNKVSFKKFINKKSKIFKNIINFEIVITGANVELSKNQLVSKK